MEPQARWLEPGSPWRRRAFFTVWGALVVGLLIAFREVLAPFVFAIVIAYVLTPVVAWLERTVRIGGRPLSRWVAVLVLYVTLLCAIGGTIAFGAPRMVTEIQRLAKQAPAIAAKVKTEWVPYLQAQLSAAAEAYNAADSVGDAAVSPGGAPAEGTALRIVPRGDGSYEVVLPERGVSVIERGEGHYLISPEGSSSGEGALSANLSQILGRALDHTESHAITMLQTAQQIVGSLVRGIFMLFLTLMVSAYLLITSDAILAFARSLVRADRAPDFDALLARIDKGLNGVIRGQLVICLINGVLSGFVFAFLQLDYWPILTVVATVLSIIPIFGAILSSIPAVAIALNQSIYTAIWVLALIIGIHQVEANLLNPKIMGDAAKVHPVLVVFSLIVGEHFFGLTGALLAVPMLSITQSLFLHFRERFVDERPVDGTSPADSPPSTL